MSDRLAGNLRRRARSGILPPAKTPDMIVSQAHTMERDQTMTKELKLHDPWLVAVWPGMGQVAISAGYYLMAKLGMHS